MHVAVSEISCQIGKMTLGIDSFTIPVDHTMDHKSVTIMPRAA
jgi:hypothetical protein